MKCPFCNNEFSKKYILIRHIDKKFKCNQEFSSENYKNYLDQLNNSKHKKNFTFILPEKSMYSDNLRDIQQQQNNLSFKCIHCLSTFTNKRSIYYHRRICKGIDQNPTNIPIQTPIPNDEIFDEDPIQISSYNPILLNESNPEILNEI